MDREINLDSILALEKQIEEYERITIRLKRTRNSLLNVSTLLPPEILARIFRCNVIPDGDFSGLPKDSYNFLLVCHHWFEVASHTPELWCFWGNSIQDWSHRHSRYTTTPLDLVLMGYQGRDLDDGLRNTLQDRAARDTIRRVHLRTGPELLNSIISSIVTKGEPQLSSIESFILQNDGNMTVDVSEFFAQYQLPKLKCLHLLLCGVSSWDLLKSQTTILTTLKLVTGYWLLAPTISELLSILSSNPLLQEFTLSCDSHPHITSSDRFSPQVSLPHLKDLHLASGFRHVFGLLGHLKLPDEMNNLKLSLYDCTPSDIPQTLGPYIGDCVQRQSRSPSNGLRLLVVFDCRTFHLCVGDAHKLDNSTRMVWFMTAEVIMRENPESEEAEGLGFDLIAHIPLEKVSDLRTTLPILHLEELCVKMCNLTHLYLIGVDLSTLFMGSGVCGPHTSEDFLCSLDSIWIIQPTQSSCDLSPLVHFLTHRATVGNKISSLRLSSLRYMNRDVTQGILPIVEDFGEVDSEEDVSWY